MNEVRSDHRESLRAGPGNDGTVSTRRSVRLQALPRCRRTVLVNPRRMSPCFEETVLRAAADGKNASNGGLNKEEVIRAIWAVTA